MYFQYDTNGMPLGFIYNDVQYFYITNNSGDVICITDENGTELAMYVYDDWGALEGAFSAHDEDWEVALAEANPIRYRGYYFDTETGYYYLQSRYYDPSICRFINADCLDFVDKDLTNGNNVFAYCANNPIMFKDPTGHFLLVLIILYAIAYTNFKSLLYPYLEKIISVKSKNKYGTSHKAKIEINLNYSSTFVSVLYQACKSNLSATSSIICDYSEEKFRKTMGRDIVFSTNCLEFEIAVHIAAFLKAKKYKDISKPNGISDAAFGKIMQHCETIDILEADVYDAFQSFVFSYYSGIRNRYHRTKSDPYYYSRYNIRFFRANSAWKEINIS